MAPHDPPADDRSIADDAVEDLLGQAVGVGGALDAQIARASVRERLFGAWQPELLVGRYHILSRAGAGGMGSVYVAYDPELDRRVAIKLLNPGRESESQQQRLLREAQAMAKLSHPNVVAVHDVGTFEGRVFVAMELVEGTTLTRWLSTRRRTWSEILRAFSAAGRGLQAAHAAGLVHRDFKPDNVLVDAQGHVKVTDFGLVRPADAPVTLDEGPRATEGSITAGDDADDEADPPARRSGRTSVLDTPLTVDGTTMGTPKYMSPEQHVGGPVDARSDQFSFCVSLYEALYEHAPFAGTSIEALATAVAKGAVRSPERPLGVPRHLEPVLRRGLRPRAADRWPSMEALLVALSRDPARARRRTVGALAAGGLVIATGWMGVRELDARQQALEEQRAALGAQCQGAEEAIAEVWDRTRKQEVHAAMLATKLGYAETTWRIVTERIDGIVDDWVKARTDACHQHQQGLLSTEAYDRRGACLALRRRELDALVGVLERSDAEVLERAPLAVQGLTPISVCDDPQRLEQELGATRDEATLARDPKLAALAEAQRGRLAESQGLFLAGRIEPAFTIATDVLVKVEPHPALRSLQALAASQVGMLADALGKGDEAYAHTERAYFGALGEGLDHVAATSASMLARYALDRADDAAFDRWNENAEAMARRVDDPGQWGRYYTSRGAHAIREGDYARSLEHFEQALAAYQQVAEQHPQTLADAHQNIGAALYYLGRLDEAEAAMQRAFERLERLYGPDHPYLTDVVHNLGNVAMRREDLDAAEGYYQREAEIVERALGPEHPTMAAALDGLGSVQSQRSRFDASLVLFQRALSISEQAHGLDNPKLVSSLINVSIAHMELGDLDAAEAMALRAREIVRTQLGPEHPRLPGVLSSLGNIQLEKGDVASGTATLRRAVEIGKAVHGEDHPSLGIYYGNYGEALRRGGEPVAAIERLRRSIALLEATAGPDALAPTQMRLSLAHALLDAGETSEARAEVERVLERWPALDGPPRGLAEARFVLARVLGEDPGADDAQRARARSLAEQARDGLEPLASHPAAARERGIVEDWLAAH